MDPLALPSQVLHSLSVAALAPPHVSAGQVREQSALALWRGNFANVLRYFPTQAFNFMFKNQIKSLFPAFDATSRFWSFFAANVLSGSIAGPARFPVLLVALSFHSVPALPPSATPPSQGS